MLLRCSQFCENLRQLREEANLTQIQVAAQMQVMGSKLTAAAYSKIELGERNIKIPDLVALKRIFNVDYDAFFKDIEPGQK